MGESINAWVERHIWKDDAFYLYPTEDQKSEHRRKEGKVKSSGVQSQSLPEGE